MAFKLTEKPQNFPFSIRHLNRALHSPFIDSSLHRCYAVDFVKFKEKVTEKNLLILLFFTFIILRLFVYLPVVIESSDDGKYVEVSQRLPDYTLYNDQPWLEHPPVFPSAIRAMSTIVPSPYFAAVMVSFASASVLFLILYRLFMLLTRSYYITFIVLLFYTLSVEFIIGAHTPFKESFGMMLIFASIFFYVRAVQFYRLKDLALATLFASFTALTFDHSIFLLPSFGLAYLFFNKEKIDLTSFHFPKLGHALIPVIAVIFFFSAWNGFKAYEYSINDYYLIGLDGAPVNTEGFKLVHVLNPNYFEDNELYLPSGITYRARDYAHRLGYMFNSVPFNVPRGLSFATMEYLLLPYHIFFMIAIYIPLALLVIIGVVIIFRQTLKSLAIHQNSPLFILALFFIFLMPIIHTKSSPRYILASFIFLFYFIACGLLTAIKSLHYSKKTQERFRLTISGFLILLIPLWIFSNPHFVFFNENTPIISKTSAFVNTQLTQEGAIMAQPGYPVQLIRQTDRKVLGLPARPDKLDMFLERYDVAYIITGTVFNDFYGFADDSARYVKDHPEKFRLVASIDENYEAKEPPHGVLAINEYTPKLTDKLYVYEVLS